MRLVVAAADFEAPPAGAVPPPDGTLAEALRAAAQALGPTTRRMLVRRASLAFAPDPSLGNRLEDTVQDLLRLSDLSGEPDSNAVAPAPLRCCSLGRWPSGVSRWLLVGGPPAASFQLSLPLSAPFLRIAQADAEGEQVLEESIARSAGRFVSLDAWMSTLRKDIGEAWLQAEVASLEIDAEMFRADQAFQVYDAASPSMRQEDRWKPARSASGWRLIRIPGGGADGRPAFGWADLKGGCVERMAPVGMGRARSLQYGLDLRAENSLAASLARNDEGGIMLSVPSRLPRPEWRLARALAVRHQTTRGEQFEFAGEEIDRVVESLAERIGIHFREE